jgi:choice-of-anchor C domain-containing protein
MKPDGDLVVSSSSNEVVWSSGTAGNSGAWLNINNGNLEIYSSSGNQVLWACAQGATTTVPNGSFESGPSTQDVFLKLFAGDTSITDWTVGGEGIDYKFTYWQASDGNRSIDLNHLNTGSIETTLTTIAGGLYTIRFDMAGNPDGAPTTKTMRVTANGGSPRDYSFDTSGTSRSSMGWTTQSYSFIASSSSTVLKFTSTIQGPYGPAIDNVR